jgi:predicted nucleic acid-binding protein
VKLIDTSSWVHALRKSGDAQVRERVRALLVDGQGAWCDIVRVELWQGVKAKAEANFLRDLDANLTLLTMTSEVWNLACALGQRSRAAGKPVPTTDLLIAACALTHHASIEHCDKHFEIILALKI